MPLDQAEIAKLIDSPSLSTVTHQASILMQELNHINDEEYPHQTCRIRDVFLCYVEYILNQLREMYDPENPLELKGSSGSARIQSLGKILQTIYSYVRYLRASSPSQAPPALQLALSQLTDYYFPKSNGDPICVVRPQWNYNLKCVPLSWELKNIAAPEVFDPDEKLEITTKQQILPVLWENWLKSKSDSERRYLGEKPPTQLSILSFAGLNTHDTLLCPLLVHELGHFIDFSFDPRLSIQNPMHDSWETYRAKLVEVLKGSQGEIDPKRVNEERNNLIQNTYICFRELVADLLAARMLGFSYFVALAEFLKTLSNWSEPAILKTGYPGIRFRLSVIFNHLVADNDPGSLLGDLGSSGIVPSIAEPVVKYIEGWRMQLESREQNSKVDLHELDSLQDPEDKINKLAEFAVRGTVEGLHRVAKKVIPDDKRAHLTSRFFERISRLDNELPPSCTPEEPNSFAEIMSASWAYQLLYGKQREIKRVTLQDKSNEYNKTCRLVLKAIELIPSSGSMVRNGKSLSDAQNDITKVSEGLKKRGVISAPHLRDRLMLEIDHPSYLGVIPLDLKAIQAASIDVKLGHWFAFARRTKLKSVQLGIESEEKLLMTAGREEVFVPLDQTFVLHPGDLVLGATLEFLALPGDLMAFVEGRSGLGRLGLLVATAAQVAPGFHGVVVLELANTGTVPLQLTPGMPIAQLVFQTLTEPLSGDQLYHGKYHCQIKP